MALDLVRKSDGLAEALAETARLVEAQLDALLPVPEAALIAYVLTSDAPSKVTLFDCNGAPLLLNTFPGWLPPVLVKSLCCVMPGCSRVRSE